MTSITKDPYRDDQNKFPKEKGVYFNIGHTPTRTDIATDEKQIAYQMKDASE